jgi:hypothetical protein
MERRPESRNGRQPGSLAAAAIIREKQRRTTIVLLGLPQDSTATSLKATKEALMRVMPGSKEAALPAVQLFGETPVTSVTIGKKALKELFKAGAVQRIGKGIPGDPFRCFSRQTFDENVGRLD